MPLNNVRWEIHRKNCIYGFGFDTNICNHEKSKMCKCEDLNCPTFEIKEAKKTLNSYLTRTTIVNPMLSNELTFVDSFSNTTLSNILHSLLHTKPAQHIKHIQVKNIF